MKDYNYKLENKIYEKYSISNSISMRSGLPPGVDYSRDKPVLVDVHLTDLAPISLNIAVQD